MDIKVILLPKIFYNNSNDEIKNDPLQNICIDEINAINLSLKLGKKNKNTRISAISFDLQGEKPLRQALSYGIDDAYIIKSNFKDKPTVNTVAEILATVLASMKYDLILLPEASFEGFGQGIASLLAKQLKLNLVSFVSHVSIKDDELKIISDYGDDYYYLKSSLPIILTVSQKVEENKAIFLSDILASYDIIINEVKIDKEIIPDYFKIINTFNQPIKKENKIFDDTKDSLKTIVNILKDKALLK